MFGIFKFFHLITKFGSILSKRRVLDFRYTNIEQCPNKLYKKGNVLIFSDDNNKIVF